MGLTMYDLDAESNTLLSLLKEADLITESQCDKAYEEYQNTGLSFKSALINLGFLKESQYLDLLSRHLDMDIVDVKNIEVSPELIEATPMSAIRMYNILPVKELDGVIHVAVADPMDIRISDELPYVFDKPIKCCIAIADDILAGINRFYPQLDGTDKDSMDFVLAELEEVKKKELGMIKDQAELEEAANSTPVVRLVNALLYQVVAQHASDLHFEPFADKFRIRYRLEKEMYEVPSPPTPLAAPIIGRIKVMANLNIAERRLPQDGRINVRIGERKVDTRVSTLPTQYGESVVIRILDKGHVKLSLDTLGMSDQIHSPLSQIIKRPHGILLVSGPTGSGKTTTLYACLKEVNVMTDKLMTAEDPVEYHIDGLIQLHVKESINLTYERALRSFLRQDPDRIMIGEIRDAETAAIAIQASLTGHFVYTTLHTMDAAGAIARLLNIDIEPFLISSTLQAVVAQRLIRTICPDCKEIYQPNDSDIKQLNMTHEALTNHTLYYGKGCIKCKDTGYQGRIGIFELLVVSEAIKELINAQEIDSVIKAQAVKEGMLTLRDSALAMLLNGKTTIEEVLHYI